MSIREITLKFMSGNSVPAGEARVTREEWETALSEVEALRAERDLFRDEASVHKRKLESAEAAAYANGRAIATEEVDRLRAENADLKRQQASIKAEAIREAVDPVEDHASMREQMHIMITSQGWDRAQGTAFADGWTKCAYHYGIRKHGQIEGQGNGN